MKRPIPNVPREKPMRDIPVNFGFSSVVLEAMATKFEDLMHVIYLVRIETVVQF
jgi:hypothetical protein